MFASIALLSSVLFLAAQADPNPTAPAPGDSFNEGSQCHVAWSADTTGAWKTMNIELMTGSNLDMVFLTTVGTVDGTDPTKATFDYPCPSVTPNSAIYFYQFTSPASTAVYWTTRFAIADSTGKTTPPAQSTQPNGDAIPWGTGALSNPSAAVPEPSSGGGNASVVTGTATSSAALSSGSSSPSASTSTSTTGGASPSIVTGSQPSTGSSPSGSSGSSASPSGGANSATANAAVVGTFVDSRVFIALGTVAFVFATLL